MHDDNEYFRLRLDAELWRILEDRLGWDKPAKPMNCRTEKSIATIDALKRSVGVQ